MSLYGKTLQPKIMDERSLVLLRRKLEALSYHDTLEANSAPLVAKLVDDLVRTSDSYRLLKIQNEQANSEITSLQTKVGHTTLAGWSCGRSSVTTWHP